MFSSNTSSEPTLWCARKLCFEAVATVREAVAHTEVTKTPLCIVSIDFSEAFDISHSYLVAMLNAHGFNAWFQQRILGMYDKAKSEVQA